MRRDDERTSTPAERGPRGWLRTANINLLLSLLALPAAVWALAGPEIYNWLLPAGAADRAEYLGNVWVPLCLMAGGVLMLWRREAPAPNLGTIKGGPAVVFGWIFIILSVLLTLAALAVAGPR